MQPLDPALESSVQSTIEYLASPEAVASLERDPYWPKWETPWWRMLLLFEMGLADRIPKVAVQKLAEAVSRHFIQTAATVWEAPIRCDQWIDHRGRQVQHGRHRRVGK